MMLGFFRRLVRSAPMAHMILGVSTTASGCLEDPALPPASWSDAIVAAEVGPRDASRPDGHSGLDRGNWFDLRAEVVDGILQVDVGLADVSFDSEVGDWGLLGDANRIGDLSGLDGEAHSSEGGLLDLSSGEADGSIAVLCTPCENDEDCRGGQCYSIGVSTSCSIRCSTDDDCGGLGECSGLAGEGRRYCVPTPACASPSHCIDGDGDGYGVGLTCMGLDCNDESMTSFPGAPETCDSLDNDCDGVVDNGYDLNVDPLNCGACNLLCEFGHANALCVAGSCAMGACDLGYVDADLDAGNGCEYACTPDPDPTELCDERDNNCDGRVDEPFDLQTDVEHCGACDTPCRPDNARGECVEGLCQVLQCAEGYFDLDGERENGCEYHCPGDGGAERCDEVDNDCDGLVDEDFDLQGDAGNCGRCGNACAYPHAGASCQAGACQMDACVDGFYDLANGAADGCEYACRPTLGGEETCDEIDNDCDGLVDEDFDLQADAGNCGRCANVCVYPNAGASCQGGACRMEACVDGFYDLANGLDDGCEYACRPTLGGEETCDGVDNDCDGTVDDAEPACSPGIRIGSD